MSVKVVAILQARLTSTRLPNKVLAELGSYRAIELMLLRIKRARTLEQIVFAVPDTPENDRLDEYLRNDLSAEVVRGSEHDVLSRFVKVAAQFPADYYVRLTCDCPLICPEVIDDLVSKSIAENYSYLSNTLPPTYPDGLDVEVISSSALHWTDKNCPAPEVREHVTLGFRVSNNRPSSFTLGNVTNPLGDSSNMRITLDESRDLECIRKLCVFFGGDVSTVNQQQIEAAYRQLRLSNVNGEIARNAATQALETQRKI